MRTVQLIQFTALSSVDFGHIPEMNRVYQVSDMEETYYNEYTDEEDEYHEDEHNAIEIIRARTTRRDGSLERRHGKVIKEDGLSYNLLTIELEDESQLFR